MSLIPHQTTFRVMGGPGEIQLFAESKEIAHVVTDSLIAEAQRIEAKYSRFLDTTIISKINQNAGGQNLEVDAETAGLIDYAAACYQTSSGLFDITSGVLRRVWNFKGHSIPSKDQISEILPLIGWDKVDWHRPNFRLIKKGMELDFGGIAKEYAVDRMANIADSYGINSALINLAGDLRVIGSPPDKITWQIGITHPRVKGGVIGTVSVKSQALATSGDYERCLEVGGKRYSHILSPKTGFPVQGFQSVTVAAESCLVAGSACTIAMLKGERDGFKFLDELKTSYFVVTSEGQVIQK